MRLTTSVTRSECLYILVLPAVQEKSPSLIPLSHCLKHRPAGLASKMLHFSTLILATVLASSKVHAAPTGPSPPQPTVPPASNSPNPLLWSGNSPLSDSVPQPLRDTFGATILGPQNVPIALENADLLAPPTTDHGSVYVSSLCLCAYVHSADGRA